MNDTYLREISCYVVIASGSAAISGTFTLALRDCFVPRNDAALLF